MSDSRITGAPGSAGFARRQRRIRRADRRVHQVVHRVDLRQRRLHRDEVVHVVLRVEEEVRRTPATGRQRGQHVVGHVALAMPSFGGAQPVHVHLQRRDSPAPAPDARSATPGIICIAAQQLLRQHHRTRSKFDVLDLDVDRRGQAEIQHLADDVGGLEIERRCRESRPAVRRAWRGCSRRSGWWPALELRSGFRRPCRRHCRWARRPG